MVDPATGLAIAQGGFAALQFVRGVIGDDGAIAASFDARGNRTAGDDRIDVERRDGSTDDVWWFSVGLEDYTFERLPVIASAIEQHGTEDGAVNPDARFWRWVAPTSPGAITSGTHPNLLVDFVVIGYKPRALVEHFSKS
jgi:hypothetical protein